LNGGSDPILAGNQDTTEATRTEEILWRKFGIQFDCGEGSAIRLDEHVFRTDLLAMSHSHSDHCRGILTLLEMRSGLKGANDKPLMLSMKKANRAWHTGSDTNANGSRKNTSTLIQSKSKRWRASFRAASLKR
jgi:ribonuclease BN (tRNA processing enzyme)